MNNLPIFNRDVFQEYAGKSLPRHVSYPMPNWWKSYDASNAAMLRQKVISCQQRRDLSLYVHIPFCEALCKFCGCNREILRKRSKGAPEKNDIYLNALNKDIARQGELFGKGVLLKQIHFGGGTPTYLSCEQLEEVYSTIFESFDVADEAEVSIEIDPRVTTAEQLALLSRLGFNRVSMGVQDFNEQVQKHVHRVQPFEMVKQTVEDARKYGFKSVNFDLIYGLPYQTLDTVTDTIKQAIELSPDRIAFYHYAQMPDKIANQRGIHHRMMPDSDTKLEMLLTAVEVFGKAGYEFVGLDHFAKPDEGLYQAQNDGTINRNFQGMTTGAELDLIGAGASSISQFIELGFIQNVRDPYVFAELVEAGDDPVIRGIELSEDDCIRQRVINQLYCSAEINPEIIAEKFNIDFNQYFSKELERISRLEADGIVVQKPDGCISLTFPLGRVLMRNVAAVFDAYLEPDAYLYGEKHAFSTSA